MYIDDLKHCKLQTMTNAQCGSPFHSFLLLLQHQRSHIVTHGLVVFVVGTIAQWKLHNKRHDQTRYQEAKENQQNVNYYGACTKVFGNQICFQ